MIKFEYDLKYNHINNSDWCRFYQLLSLGNTDFATFIRPAFQAIYDNREQMLSLNRAGFSPVLLDALREYFHASEARDDSSDASDSTDYGAQNMNNYRTAYRIGGIYACLLLWFSYDMRETPEEMIGIAVSMGNNNF
ncbi:MAG: hypothetical protein DUD27_06305 [Lachnospiraceae bacterium]|uniref:Uncharacterized protein n=1 Tax=Candidatus Weimeria bifida TaxID=2599074 RepID=A0A6N7IX82_9FIRM|nr:hypothetical protein [Candidatus Weimeria bifida]RRF96137.1 MAG: hypothetical protein DUD27_06305 [Lachnospiraceae bacterium]